MSHLPMGTFSGAWGQFTQGLQTSRPKPPCLAKYCCKLGNEPIGLDTGFTEATTQTPPPLVADVDMDRCTTPLFGMEGENSTW